MAEELLTMQKKKTNKKLMSEEGKVIVLTKFGQLQFPSTILMTALPVEIVTIQHGYLLVCDT